MDPIEREVRDAHPDWSEDQVAAEVARIKAERTRRSDPPEPDEDRNRAFAELRRRAEQAERERDEARNRLAARERDEAERRGEWERLARQYEQERDDWRGRYADLSATVEIERRARARSFISSDEAIALLPRDVDRSDMAAVEQALDQLAEQRPHLIDSGDPPPPGPSGGPGGRPENSAMTREGVAKLAKENPAEFNRRFEAGEIPASALGG